MKLTNTDFGCCDSLTDSLLFIKIKSRVDLLLCVIQLPFLISY